MTLNSLMQERMRDALQCTGIKLYQNNNALISNSIKIMQCTAPNSNIAKLVPAAMVVCVYYMIDKCNSIWSSSVYPKVYVHVT